MQRTLLVVAERGFDATVAVAVGPDGEHDHDRPGGDP
jgi:hypothetical protein